LRRSFGQPREQLARPPSRVAAPRCEDRPRRRVRHAVRTMVRSSTPVLESGHPLFPMTTDPLVTRLSAHPEACTQLTHRIEPALLVFDESNSLVQGRRLRPRHRVPPSMQPRRGCQGCCGSEVSTLYRVYTVDRYKDSPYHMDRETRTGTA